jgi:hypothetical protein
MCVLVGQRQEISAIIKNDRQRIRFTQLRQRLTGEKTFAVGDMILEDEE